MMKKISFLVLNVILICLLSCATTGPGGDKSLIIIPSSQEVAIGVGMAVQVEAEHKLLADQDWQSYINDVGQKIVAVCDRKDIQYHFKVIESDQVNAFAAPGGFIYFYTGLLKQMDTEAEMAAVIAHEISHVVARHGVKRLQASLGVAVAYQLVFGSEGTSEVVETAIAAGMTLVFSGYSRSNEREADRYGIYYMTEAGYNPNGALGMFDKLAALGANSGEASTFEKLVRSHPETEERIKNARNQITEMGVLSSDLISNETHYQQMRSRLP